MSNSKKWYKLVFKQIQPIHVGAGSEVDFSQEKTKKSK